jgi:hypothetical protein
LVVNAAAWAGGKCATNGLPALFGAEELLIGAGKDSGQEEGFAGEAEKFSERAGDEGGLVVATLAFALGVERDGNDDVGLKSFAKGETGEEAGEKDAERLEVFKFEDEDGFAQISAVDGPASGAIEGQAAVFSTAAGEAEHGRLRSSGAGGAEGEAANIANELIEGCKGIQTGVADGQAGGFGEQLSAQEAAGGEDHTEQGGAKIAEPAGVGTVGDDTGPGGGGGLRQGRGGHGASVTAPPRESIII